MPASLQRGGAGRRGWWRKALGLAIVPVPRILRPRSPCDLRATVGELRALGYHVILDTDGQYRVTVAAGLRKNAWIVSAIRDARGLPSYESFDNPSRTPL